MEKAKRIAAKEAETWAEEGYTVVIGDGES
jgi:hypothetical protein